MSIENDMYKRALEHAGVKNHEVHHEFVSGVHGIKIDFDVTHKDRSSSLYIAGVMLKASEIMRSFDGQGYIGVLGIDTGTTLHAKDVASVITASGFAMQAIALTTKKRIEDGQKVIEVTDEASSAIVDYKINHVAIDDDVGTTGSSTAQPIDKLRELGVDNIAVFYDWIRNPSLPHLDAKEVAYSGIIRACLTDYDPSDCRLCDDNIPLVPYSK